MTKFSIMSAWMTTMASLLVFWLLILIMMGLEIYLEVFSFLLKSTMDLSISLECMGSIFLVGLLMISVSVFLWGRYYMKESESLTFFFMVLFFFVCSMLLLVLSNNFFVVFLGWEGLGLTSFLLIVFYQNWLSFNGGLLTLLTNRLGDAILMISFSYWIVLSSSCLSILMSVYIIFLMSFLSFTKSAQVPFTSWLPAAMAAPTPVSALVHSSTLVTAGVWLMIRFGQLHFFSSSLLFLMGVMTLLIASLAALVEKDAKKVVALSTLSQLGLMYISLFMGGPMISLFHLLMHAAAKANLFLMVGSLLHSRFSQQDIRFMSSGLDKKIIFLMVFISIISLSGMVFTSGFFSKDFILLSHYKIMNSILTGVLVLGIISLTLAYCYKLLTNLMSNSSVYLCFSSPSIPLLFPSMLLSIFSLILGFFFTKNMFLVKLKAMTLSGCYWIFLLLSFFFVLMKKSIFSKWFKLQVILINELMKISLLEAKKSSLKMSSGFLENFYLTSALYPIYPMMLVPRVILLLSVSLIVILIL